MRLNSNALHINLYDLAFTGAIFSGLTFVLLLWFTKKVNQIANRYLALALYWILEIQFVDRVNNIGGYFEQLL
jgi:hypothetical protein